MRRGFLKHVHPLAQYTPILSHAMDPCFTFNHYKDYLSIIGYLGSSVSCVEPVQREANVTPTRTFRRDLVNFTTVTEGFFQKVSHRVVPFGPSPFVETSCSQHNLRRRLALGPALILRELRHPTT